MASWELDSIERGIVEEFQKSGDANTAVKSKRWLHVCGIGKPKSGSWLGNGHIEQSTFFFEVRWITEAPGVRKLSVCNMDDKDSIRFQSLCRENRGERVIADPCVVSHMVAMLGKVPPAMVL